MVEHFHCMVSRTKLISNAFLYICNIYIHAPYLLHCRWNSTLDMLMRLEEQHSVINAVAADTALGKRGRELGGKLFTFEQHLKVSLILL